jgi:molybdate transport system ATP-binding protein
VSLHLQATVADRDVEAEIEVGDGETLAVLGPNGAGKSTLLAVAAGLLRPDRGRVVLDERVLTGDGTFVPTHDRRVALLAQEPLLFPHLSVLENVAFGPRSRRTSRREAHAVARHWLAEVGAAELAARRPGQVSGGQGQRIALARALAAEPRLLLLDEPMAALDVAVLPALRQTLKRVLADRTVVLVTHDVLDALLLADRVVVMDGGRIVEAGTTADVLEKPRSAFAARIAGLNMVAGRWRGGAVAGADGVSIKGLAIDPVPVQDDDVVAVFRPSAVSVFREAPGGSPRNSLAVTVTDLEPLGDQVRVRAGHLAADVTVQSAAELDLAPGTPVVFAVKASEVAVYRT